MLEQILRSLYNNHLHKIIQFVDIVQFKKFRADVCRKNYNNFLIFACLYFIYFNFFWVYNYLYVNCEETS